VLVGQHPLLDYLIGAQQDRLGEFDTERFRSSHVYYQLELGWLLDGEICRLRTPENFVYVCGRTAKLIWNVWSIGDEATDIDKIASFVYRRKSLLSGELDYARSLTEGKGIDEE
jgi:hypothetical protein